MSRERYRYAKINLDDLSGGLNSNPLSKSVKDNELTDCLNTIWYDGSLRSPPGFYRHSGQLGGSGSSAKINGIADFLQRDGDQFLVTATDSDIFYYDTSTHVWTSIKGGLTISDAKWQFIVQNDILIGTNYTDAPISWTGTGNVSALAGTPPDQAKYVAGYNSRAVLANCVYGGAHAPASVFYSDVDDPESWNTTTQEWSFDTDDGQEITGVKQIGEKLLVFKSNSVGYVSGYDLQTWFVNRAWRKGVGCVSGYTIRNAYLVVGSAIKEVLVFMSQSGLRAIDEAGTIYYLPTFQSGEEYKCYEYFDTLNNAVLPSAVGSFYRKRGWIFMFYGSSGSNDNDIGCIYDYGHNSLWPLDGINANCTAEVYNPTTEEYDLYIGSNDGIIYYLSETLKGFEDSTELVTNGDMELDANWTSYGTPTSNSRDNGQAYSGTYSRKVVTDAADEGIYQDITTEVGKKYRAWGYAYVSAGECYIEKQDTDGTDTATGSSSDASTWTRVSLEFTATSTTSRIIFRNDTTAASTFYVDDASVRCVEVESYAETKYYDLGSEQEVKYMREAVPLISATDTGGMTVTLTYNKGGGVVTSDTISLTSGSLDWSDDLDWSADIDWASFEEKSDPLENLTQDAFRTIRIKTEANTGTLTYSFNSLLMSVKVLGERWFNY